MRRLQTAHSSAVVPRASRRPAGRRLAITLVALGMVAVVALLAGAPPTASAADPAEAVAWEPWQHLAGVVDIAGPRRDGRLVVVAAGRLFLVAPDGASAPFAAGPDGYGGDVASEQYLVVAPALPAQPAGCAFVQDDAFILDLTTPPGIARVDAAGHASRLATIPNADGLWGIALDTTGRFGYRLLVAGTNAGHTLIFAVDCQGSVTTITDAAPSIEGGFAVAPADFGPYGGALIAPDELSGQIWAIDPDGTASLVLAPDLPTGGDTGVESLGFVPPGFGAGGSAYLADRGTPDNPFPGTDSILRLSSQALQAAGVQAGDLLVATEGGGSTVVVRCAATCTSRGVADGPAGGGVGHIEGHIVLIP